MSIGEIISQIRSLRMQLDVLEARLRGFDQGPAGKPHTFADLAGIVAGECQSTAEDIEQALYRGPAGANP
jgi:hypothetical protein